MSSLVQFIALYHVNEEGSPKEWPTHKNDEFWGRCAEFVNSVSGNSRNGKNMCIQYMYQICTAIVGIWH